MLALMLEAYVFEAGGGVALGLLAALLLTVPVLGEVGLTTEVMIVLLPLITVVMVVVKGFVLESPNPGVVVIDAGVVVEAGTAVAGQIVYKPLVSMKLNLVIGLLTT